MQRHQARCVALAAAECVRWLHKHTARSIDMAIPLPHYASYACLPLAGVCFCFRELVATLLAAGEGGASRCMRTSRLSATSCCWICRRAVLMASGLRSQRERSWGVIMVWGVIGGCLGVTRPRGVRAERSGVAAYDASRAEGTVVLPARSPDVSLSRAPKGDFRRALLAANLIHACPWERWIVASERYATPRENVGTC